MVYNLFLNGLWLTAPFPNARRCHLAGPATEILQRKNIHRLPCGDSAILGHDGVVEGLYFAPKRLWCQRGFTVFVNTTPV